MEDLAAQIKRERPDEFVRDAYEKMKTVSQLAHGLILISRKIEDEYDKILGKTYGENDADDAEILAATSETERLLLTSRWELSDLLKAFSAPNIYDGVLRHIEAVTSEEQTKFHSVFEVKAELKDGLLLIKMPPLPSMFHSQFGNGNRYRSQPSARWFVHELEAALYQIPERPPFNFENHFSYLHVIKALTNTTPDSDNRDTKHITDTVCGYLGCSDSATATSFSSMAVQSEKLPEGSYLMVSPTFGKPPSLDFLVRQFSAVDFTQKSDEFKKQKSDEI